MDLIILTDGTYHLVEVTKQMTAHLKIIIEVDCFDLCDILRLNLTTYYEEWNLHIMNDDTGLFYGCVCK